MADIVLEYLVDGDNLQDAGTASSQARNSLKRLGIDSAVIRRVGICMYEGEINMVIHANGGKITLSIGMDKISIKLADNGPGIADIEKAMQEGYSTADAEARSIGFGAGMGLPNMKKNSDEMTIDSKPGIGTTILMGINI